MSLFLVLVISGEPVACSVDLICLSVGVLQCHCYCCVSLLWVNSHMSGRGDKVTVRRFSNFAVCVIYVRRLQFLSSRLSGRWRLIFMVFSMKLVSCHPSDAYGCETASRYFENLCTLDLSDLSSLKGFSIVYSFSILLFDKTHQFPQCSRLISQKTRIATVIVTSNFPCVSSCFNLFILYFWSIAY
jgi:hypothetical protein